tara:strand:- start:275 stop:1444 length:1170 start_codon:yes stop_codon:yes gene_type:complete
MKKIVLVNLILSSTFLFSECSDLSQSECLQYPQYCEWSETANLCTEIGGGGGGSGSGSGPYEFTTITESDGLRNGPDYRDGVLYYPLDGNPPFKNVVLSPGFGGNSASMSSWAAFYASHGFVAMTVGPNDEIMDSHYQRGEGLIDGVQTIIEENSRLGSPVYGLIDENSFTVSGYSMGGGASHDAALIAQDNGLDHVKAVISLNPTVLFEDCNLCPANTYEGETYCICLVPELIAHSLPSLIFAGEVEVNELNGYEGLLGQDIYANLPAETDKILFEGANSGHGFAELSNDEVSEKILSFMNYFILNDDNYCENLQEVPSSSSQYLTNFDCEQSLLGDLNADLIINVQDVVLTVNLVLTGGGYNNSADLNLDNIVNVQDIILLINIILS